MKKTLYSLLLVVTAGLIGYTAYYTYGEYSEGLLVAQKPVVAATTTPENQNVYTTKTGKKITVIETNPNGQSLSTIAITTSGLATNTPITLEKNKLMKVMLADLNSDTFDELILITQAQGSGSYGEAVIYTTAKDTELTSVLVPEVEEKDTEKGGLFEGYAGHDTFTLVENTLIREFPTYTATNTNAAPEGPKKKILYTLTEKDGMFLISLSKAPVVSAVPLTASSTVSATISLVGTSWVWVSGTQEGKEISAPTGGKFVLTFNKDGTMGSLTDCNTVGGSYLLKGTTLTFGAMMSTLMFCDGSQESVYTGMLSKTTAYSIASNTLTLSLSDKGTMKFTLKK